MKTLQPAWISATLSLISLVVVGVTAVVLVNRPVDGWPAYTDQEQTTVAPAGPPPKYTFAKVVNACDLVDLAAVERLSAGRSMDPMHHEIKAGRGGSLTCQGIYQRASITFTAQLGDSRELYRLGKEQTATTGSGRSSGTAPEFGADTYFTLEQSTATVFGGQVNSVRTDLGVLDANLYVTIHIEVSKVDTLVTGDEILNMAKAQMKSTLETLKS
ncbi:hypothetical protein [Nocardia wallacei]|uniref:DUF5642 domain-containing protein n=1 Tax=Nocardia wallacei TaxID=480035 RepID=A0A7G1KJV1_9NOCA|nr:hypothetical protein [Nocardia wallacei]BCK54836.1 hypothetical protein NWFMUON74_26080 [Nocardia wallacei]